MDPAWEGVVEWEGGKKGFPTGPHIWRDLDGDRMECVGVGQVDGKLREERICTVKKTYWGKVVGDGVQGANGEEGEEKKEEKSGDETLAEGVDKLDIGEEKGKEMNGKDVSPPVSPALPSTVA